MKTSILAYVCAVTLVVVLLAALVPGGQCRVIPNKIPRWTGVRFGGGVARGGKTGGTFVDCVDCNRKGRDII